MPRHWLHSSFLKITDRKDITMPDTKAILSSRTVWANLVGLMALFLSLSGTTLAANEQAQLVEALLQIVASASFVASTVFRIIAQHALR
jgi:hypothetical protein